MIYDDKEKEEILEKKILEIFNIFEEYPEEPFSNRAAKIKAYFSSYLATNQLLFKHKCFASEKEYRIIVALPKEKTPKELPILFRNGNAGITPYIELRIGKYNLIGIMTSPFAKNTEIRRLALQDFCNTKGLECKILSSNLPIAF